MTTATPNWEATVERWSKEPLDFVLEAVFQMTRETWAPWVPGTPKPEQPPIGPELWQGQLLDDIAEANRGEGSRWFTVRAAHGVGKTTIQSWIVLWFLLFKRPVKIPVTANSQDQLRDVFWAEVAFWHRRLPSVLADLIDISVERIVVKALPNEAFAVARTARPERPEALQGFHSANCIYVIDEASGIEDIIFEVARGALSSKGSWQFLFGNPTRPTGYFWKSHTEWTDRFRTYHIPADSSSRATRKYAEDMAADYGEDSNVYRIRVLGEFPVENEDGVIPKNWMISAVNRDVEPTERAIVWGVDVARFGDDSTALAKRRGNTLLEPVREWRKMDLMQTVGIIMHQWRESPDHYKPQSINVDVIGIGAGVADRLRELGLPVRDVNVAESLSTRDTYMRLRDELWFDGRKWFESLAVRIPDDQDLIEELASPTYKIMDSRGRIKVEGKDEMKRRGRKSPNKADAFLLTFAGGDYKRADRNRGIAIMTYDPFALGTEEYERAFGQQATSGLDWSPYH